MGKPTGFLEHARDLPQRRPVRERVTDYREIYRPFGEAAVRRQAARCMDCGVPTCHAGCPLGNLIPDFNDLVYRGQWREALAALQATNNFPEFTGRLCPAPCEEACVLSINAEPVTIEEIEKQIVERAFREQWINPLPPARRTGRRVAVVGSGPAGLAAAQQLNRAGHRVVVFERDEAIGGLLRLGIPDFKMEKHVIDRRLALLEAEGIGFETGAEVDAATLQRFDAVLLATGATVARDLPIPGRELDGIHLAMDYLVQQNRRVAGTAAPMRIDARGKHVIVIGGGDTGSDCIGTANRQGAKSVVNLELMQRPPRTRDTDADPWPYWPVRLRTSSSHEEGVARAWGKLTQRFVGVGQVEALEMVDVELRGGRLHEVAGSQQRLEADLVLLALGFTGAERPLPDQLGARIDARGNIETDGFATTASAVFAAGDARRGQSLVVWAISEGREAARAIDRFLLAAPSRLPGKGPGDLVRGRP